jgi:isoleucyl-tRNA synthetase
MIIINPDPEYHADIKSLESYIQEEMNVRNVIVTAEEEKYGVKYKLVPDAKALGTKFKKDASKIRNALDKVPMEDIVAFVSKKTIEISGFTLTESELSVTRYFDESNSNYHAHFTNQVLVILDVTLDQSLINEGNAREIINRVQRLRKKAGLVPTDDVRYMTKITHDPENELKVVFETQRDTLMKYLKQEIEVYVPCEALIEEEQEVNGCKFLLALIKRQ